MALCFSSSIRKAAVPSFAFPFANPLFAGFVSIWKEEVVSKLKQDQRLVPNQTKTKQNKELVASLINLLKSWSLDLLSAAFDL